MQEEFHRGAKTLRLVSSRVLIRSITRNSSRSRLLSCRARPDDAVGLAGDPLPATFRCARRSNQRSSSPVGTTLPEEGKNVTEAIRRRALIYLASAAALFVLIGAALPRLVFEPGLPPPRFAGGQIIVPSTPWQPPIAAPAGIFFKVLSVLALAIFVACLVYALARTGLWREALRRSLPLLLILLAGLGLLSLAVVRLPDAQIGLPLPGGEDLPQPEAFAPVPLGEPPPWLIWFVGGVLAAAAVVLLALALRERSQGLGQKKWQAEAEAARQAILAGDDLEEVIVRCYLRMGAALQAEQGIERAPFMTTGDFERLLVAHGVLQAPVHELTSLYEAVRYGRWQPGPGDEARVLKCLEAILQPGRTPLLEA